MYTIANRVLGIAILAFILVWSMDIFQIVDIPEVYQRGLYWITESAVIGAVADWFAIEALFRKPLGISFHTALIPRQKKVLEDKVVQLVRAYLVDSDQLTEKVKHIDFYAYGKRYIEDSKEALIQVIYTWMQEKQKEGLFQHWSVYLQKELGHIPLSKMASGYVPTVMEYLRDRLLVWLGSEASQERLLMIWKARVRRKGVLWQLGTWFLEELQILSMDELIQRGRQAGVQFLQETKQENTEAQEWWQHFVMDTVQVMERSREGETDSYMDLLYQEAL